MVIASLMLHPADLLILDEPTNDLDIPSLEVLEESLADFGGALVLVTHDRFLLDRVSTELMALDGKGGVRSFAGLWQWEAAREEAAEQEKRSSKPAAAKPPPAPASSGPKRLTWNEQRELERMEDTILAAEEELHALQKRMEDRAVLADHVQLREVCTAADAAQMRVQELYARWQELESRKR